MKWVYSFSASETDGNKDDKRLLGGKGANLAEMSSLKLPVPPGFTVSTQACLDYQKEHEIKPSIKEQVDQALLNIEKITGKKFGCKSSPLLFSVRSGAAISMPGMMDTVLNLGLNDETVEALGKASGSERFAWDSYRRFIQMYANVVMDFNSSLLESLLEDLKEARGVESDADLKAEDLKRLVEEFKKTIMMESGESFPTDPKEQLWLAIEAVFKSWENPRARKYREINNIDHKIGTAVNVQSMVYGNMGDDCATGVCFTRDPSSGEKIFFGEYLVNAQGEDVVAGIRTPGPLNDESKNDSNKTFKTLKELMPKAYSELVDVYQTLEKHYKDMQDIEFTIENSTLYILQTRSGKRTAQAAIKIANDLVEEKILNEEEAILSIDPEMLNHLLHPRLDPNAERKLLTKGLPASPGAGAGEIVFHSDRAVELAEQGKAVLLVRNETSPEDIHGMNSAKGILTAKGGMTSHAAVVARGMGKPCVAGCSSLLIDANKKTLSVDGKEFREGEFITIDGGSGEVFEGQISTIDAQISDDFAKFMALSDKHRSMGIRANADNSEDSEVALNFGAQGIGLCRTEHMFFDPERILAVREMIFAQKIEEREKALNKLLPFQKNDFIKLFKAMDGKPVNIRLLDPPLHEFLPQSQREIKEFADYMGITAADVHGRVEALHEFNPMLGHRGCRLGITYPEVYLMQARAIIEAGVEVSKEEISVFPEIMIPLVSHVNEFKRLKDQILHSIQDVFEEDEVCFDFKIGTMIELPRAAITADEIAEYADFFSFGTNDLTQTTFGLSRDDAGKFLPQYVEEEILKVNPFVSIDEKGVGFLVEHATKLGRKTNEKIHIGICGEHGGDPKSIEFCQKIGLDYVSCSPYRVPIARLAAAQAAIRGR